MSGLLSGWMIAVVLASDPVLEGIAGAEAVTIERGGERWTISIQGRSLVTAPPQTAEEQATLRALVTSLITELGLVPTLPLELPPEPAIDRLLQALDAMAPPPDAQGAGPAGPGPQGAGPGRIPTEDTQRARAGRAGGGHPSALHAAASPAIATDHATGGGTVEPGVEGLAPAPAPAVPSVHPDQARAEHGPGVAPATGTVPVTRSAGTEPDAAPPGAEPALSVSGRSGQGSERASGGPVAGPRSTAAGEGGAVAPSVGGEGASPAPGPSRSVIGGVEQAADGAVGSVGSALGVPGPGASPGGAAAQDQREDLDWVDSPELHAPPPRHAVSPGDVADPAALRSRAPWRAWVAPSVALRSRVTPRIGGAVGIERGAATGVGLRLGWLPPRPIAYGPEATLGAIELGGTICRDLSQARVSAGLGGAARTYTQHGVAVSRHVAPQLSAGAGLPLSLGGLRVALQATTVVDLAVTRIGIFEDREPLSPASLRISLEVGSRAEPEATSPTLEGEHPPQR